MTAKKVVVIVVVGVAALWIFAALTGNDPRNWLRTATPAPARDPRT